MADIYLDTAPILANMKTMGFPNHIQSAVQKMLQSGEQDFSQEAMEKAIQRLGSIIQQYEDKNPDLAAPWAAPDHPANFNPNKPRNQGILTAGNFNPMQAAISGMGRFMGGW